MLVKVAELFGASSQHGLFVHFLYFTGRIQLNRYEGCFRNQQ